MKTKITKDDVGKWVLLVEKNGDTWITTIRKVNQKTITTYNGYMAKKGMIAALGLESYIKTQQKLFDNKIHTARKAKWCIAEQWFAEKILALKGWGYE